MGSRATQIPTSYTLKYKLFPLVLQGAGSGKAPTLKYGDPNGAFFTAPVFVSTGIWTITTVDGWYQHIGCNPTVMQATGAGTLTIQLSPAPAQITTATATNQAYCWKFTFNTFVSGGASDMLAGDQANILFHFNDLQIPI
jgi:hypothetical protein